MVGRPITTTLVQIGCAALTLTLAPQAYARGGDFVLDGGTAYERAQVTEALAISSFDWSLVPGSVTVHIAPGLDSDATRGEIWLDSHLLDAGRFSWGVVQHEYAHQVDFFLLTETIRARLQSLLGAKAWCWDIPGFTHSEYGCERFASTLAWAYWPDPSNCMKPQSKNDESAAMPPASFRALLAHILGVPALRNLSPRR